MRCVGRVRVAQPVEAARSRDARPSSQPCTLDGADITHPEGLAGTRLEYALVVAGPNTEGR